jgi:CheY-like chemotaxis protein
MSNLSNLLNNLLNHDNTINDFFKLYVEILSKVFNSQAVIYEKNSENKYINIAYSPNCSPNLLNISIDNNALFENNSQFILENIDFSTQIPFQNNIIIKSKKSNYLILLIKQDNFSDNEKDLVHIFALLFDLKISNTIKTTNINAKQICSLIDKNFNLYTSTLQSIIGSIVFLKSELTAMHTVDLVNNIYNQTYGLLLSLNEQKEFHKIIFNKEEINTSDVDCKTVIENYSNYLKNKITDRNLEFRQFNVPETSSLQTDAAKFNFIIEKLLGFLVKYSNSSVVLVEYHSSNNNIEKIDFKVDLFMLSQNVLATIFSPNSITITYDGKFIPLTSFSLPILSLYLELLGYDLQFSLDTNNTLCASLVLNRKHTSPIWKEFNLSTQIELANAPISTHATQETPKEPEQKKTSYKILLAEDYKHSQIIVTRLLKKNGYEDVVTAENGQEAIDAAKSQKFDLILMDMQMPVKSGFEAIQEIRTLDEYKNTPIIALTAFAMKGDKEKCIEAGATDYIPKPIDSKELLDKISTYLS